MKGKTNANIARMRNNVFAKINQLGLFFGHVGVVVAVVVVDVGVVVLEFAVVIFLST